MKAVKAVKAVAVRPLLVGLLDSLILSGWASVGPWFEPRSRSQKFWFGSKRLGRWPRRFFSSRRVGIGCVTSVSATDTQRQSRSYFGRGIQGRNHDSERTICRCASS